MDYTPCTLEYPLLYSEQVRKAELIQQSAQLQTKNYTIELVCVYRATTVTEIAARHHRIFASRQPGDHASIRTCQFDDLRR
jgi:hypothetical protein